jgi:centromere protein J
MKVLEALQEQNKENVVNLEIQAHPSDSKKKIIVESTDSEESQEEEESVNSRTLQDHHVRFSDKIDVVETTGVQDNEETITDDAATMLSTDLEAIELSKTSTPNEKQNFLDFKKKLLGKKVPVTQQKNVQENEIKEQGNLMKSRLEELEREIETFREQNSVLIKMKQELELEKIQFDNDREEMLEKMKDERVKIEIFLHDERLKLEDEKKRCEKMIREARNPNRKEREETTKLKATVEELKDELKAKEAKHGSSQARFRAQIRQLEKDNQSQKLELEVLRKEIRKLELENVRLRRETNSKMLQEINRNIAKLAPPSTDNGNEKKKEVKKPPARRSEPTIQKTKKRFTSEPDLTAKSEDSSDEDLAIRNKENEPKKPPEIDIPDSMKREIDNPDGSKDIWYPNGNLKKISPDGMLIRMLYYNKDIKETNMNEGTIKYYYADRNTWHTTYIDGLEILEYPE